MRRFIAAAVIVAALASLAVMAGRAQAEDGPTQATATRRFVNTDTPGPSPTFLPATETPKVTAAPTKSVCPFLDLYCRKAFLPMTRLDPSPTPHPTATDEPELVCRERLYDGSFEEKDSGWTARRKTTTDKALIRVGSDIFRAAHGDRMLYIEPAANSDVGVESRPITGFGNGTVTRATLGFSWSVGTYDPYKNSDDLRAYVYDPEGESVVPLWYRHNQDWREDWARETIDVTGLVNRGWRTIAVNFSAHSDSLFDTWWDIDAVSLEICAWE